MQTQITEKDRVIADLRKPNEETMAELRQKIKENWKKLGVSDLSLEKSLSEVQSYQQLVDLEQKILATKWWEIKNSLQMVNKDKNNLKTYLTISLLSLIIIILGGLSLRIIKKKDKNK